MRSAAHVALMALLPALGAEEKECIRIQACGRARGCAWGVPLTDVLDTLPEEDLDALLYNARRLLKGQSEYGILDLVNNDRDFDEEIRQERSDIENYESMAELRARLRDARDRLRRAG